MPVRAGSGRLASDQLLGLPNQRSALPDPHGARRGGRLSWCYAFEQRLEGYVRSSHLAGSDVAEPVERNARDVLPLRRRAKDSLGNKTSQRSNAVSNVHVYARRAEWSTIATDGFSAPHG